MTLEERVLEVLKNTFDLDTVECTCSQKTCDKWDSMGQLNLVVDLETEFNISLEPEEIGEMKSVEDIVKVLQSKRL